MVFNYLLSFIIDDYSLILVIEHEFLGFGLILAEFHNLGFKEVNFWGF